MSGRPAIVPSGPAPLELSTTLPADTPLSEVAARARRVEALGLDTLQVPETIHDPFVVSALALEHTTRLRVRTSMVLAFPRSPMVTAYSAWDLARFSSGRFSLGLGTQVRGNIVGRYSSTWVAPVAQMRDYVASMRAIFASFRTGASLDHHGPHYAFDRLQPYFNPGPLEVAEPDIVTGGIGERMVALAGEVADGMVCHPVASHPRYLDEAIIPALARGAAAAGRRVEDVRLVANARLLTGRTEADVAHATEAARSEMAFLYSTPAYRRQLEVFGLAELGERLGGFAAEKRWDDMPGLLTDEVLAQLVPRATLGELPTLLRDWYAGRCSGLNLALPDQVADDDYGWLVEQLRGADMTVPGPVS